MVEADKKRFAVMMNWLTEKFPQAGAPREMSKPDLLDWFEALVEVRIERLEWGAKHWFATEKFFPKPVELRQAALLAPSSVLPMSPAPQITEQATPAPEAVKEALRRLDSVFGTRLERSIAGG